MCPRHGPTGNIECHHVPFTLNFVLSGMILVHNPSDLPFERFRATLNLAEGCHMGNPGFHCRTISRSNIWLATWSHSSQGRCSSDAKKRPHPTIPGKTVWQVFEEERPFLMAYRGPFDGFHAIEVAVSKTCLVRFDNNQYSVAARAVGRPVDVRAYADRIAIRQDGEIVAEHPRSFGRGQIRGTTCRS